MTPEHAAEIARDRDVDRYHSPVSESEQDLQQRYDELSEKRFRVLELNEAAASAHEECIASDRRHGSTIFSNKGAAIIESNKSLIAARRCFEDAYRDLRDAIREME